MQYDINAFYENIQCIFKEREIQQKEIYSEIGMSQGNFSNAFNRKNGKQFSVDQILKIANYLDVSLDDLFSREKKEKNAHFLEIPEKNKWSYSDVLKVIFSLRKSGIKFDFEDIIIKRPEHSIDHLPLTALVFTERLNKAYECSFVNSNSDMEINNILHEWANIISCTKNIEEEAREVMISAWEEDMIKQVHEIIIDENVTEYQRDNETKIFHVFKSDERPF